MVNITQARFEELLDQFAHDFAMACTAQKSEWANADKYSLLATASRNAVLNAVFPRPGQVNTIVCPVCRTGHDLPLCPERK